MLSSSFWLPALAPLPLVVLPPHNHHTRSLPLMVANRGFGLLVEVHDDKPLGRVIWLWEYVQYSPKRQGLIAFCSKNTRLQVTLSLNNKSCTIGSLAVHMST